MEDLTEPSFGSEHADILFWMVNIVGFIAATFFFLWIRDRLQTLKDDVKSVLGMCTNRAASCPMHFRTKVEAERDWDRLNGTLEGISENIEKLRQELKEANNELWRAVNHHSHTESGKVVKE